MPGYEDLTSDQLIFITQMIFFAVSIYAIGHILSSFFNWKASKNIRFRIKQEVAENIAKDLQKKPFIVKIRGWIKRYREKKEEKLLGNPS